MAASDALQAAGAASAGPMVSAVTAPPAMTSAAASLSAAWIITATPCGSVWRKYTPDRGRLLLTSKASFCSGRYPDSPAGLTCASQQAADAPSRENHASEDRHRARRALAGMSCLWHQP